MAGRGLFRHAPQPQQPYHRALRQSRSSIGLTDDFSRGAVTDGWGQPTTGNASAPYVLTGTAADFDTTGSVGTISVSTSVTRTAVADNIRQVDQIFTGKVKRDKLALGSDVSIRILLRRVDSLNYYRLQVRFEPTFGTDLQASKVVAGAATNIGGEVDITAREADQANTYFFWKAQVTGTSPSLLKFKVWREDHSEPASWDIEESDSDAALQVSSAIGVEVATGAISNAPVLLSWDDFNLIETAVAQNLQRTASDTVSLSESVARVLTLARTAADTVTASESVSRTLTLLRSVSDSVGLSDSVARVLSLVRTASDTVTVGNTVARVVSLARTASDTVGLSDAVTRTGTFLRTVADAVTISESVAGLKVLPRTVADSVTLSDSVARVLTLARTLSDSVTASEFVARVLTLLRSVSDGVTVGNTVARVVTNVRAAADSVTLSDSVARIVTNLRAAADSVTASDTVARVVGLFRSNADSVTISESVDALKIGGGIKSATAADSVSLTESVSRVVTLIRTAADAVGISESVAQLITTVATMADSVSLSDAVSRATAARRQVSDTVTVSDTVDVIKNGVPLSGLGHHVVGDVRRRRALGGLDTDRRRRLFQQIIEDTEPLTLDDEDAIAALLLAEDD